MLVELKVSNFAIIDSVQIGFRGGLNILSGETGAGKSVLLKSLALLMGEKAEPETVRTGCESATIEGFFDLSKRADLTARLEAMGIEVEDEAMIVRRVISRQGKSRVYINGNLSPVSSLRDLVTPLVEVTSHGAPLIEMTGQHDNRQLMSRVYHLELLDQFAGTWALRQTVCDGVRKLIQLKAKIDDIRNQAFTRTQRLDFLSYQRDEIEALKLKPGEEVELESEVKRMKNSSRLTGFVEQAEACLYSDDDSAMSRLQTILMRAGEFSKYDPQLNQLAEPLAHAKTLVEDVVYELRDYMKSLDSDPEKLESLEKRLSDLRHLQKKYGATAEQILNTLGQIQDELAQLTDSENNLQEIEKEKHELEKTLRLKAIELSEKRVKAAVELEKRVGFELKDLNMKGLIFRVRVERVADLTLTGLDEVEFMTQTSKSDPARSLSKFASGGELSRILLSIKQAVGQSKYPRTYLFDEVDTGVSGPTAEKVGRKLKAIASGQQVICVTHLPQVASFADVHFYIHKSQRFDSVEMCVVELTSHARVDEIARLISGEQITQTSMAHAEQLLKTSISFN